MREAARALDDVSDHLGEVLRRADDLLVEWSRFGAQVRDQVDREAAAIGGVVEGAVGRAAASGLDRAIGDRLRALTGELERLEQRARAASRAVVEQRDADRRLLWGVIAGVVLANALLVVLILRKPAAAPVAEPIRLDPVAAPAAQPGDPSQGAAATPDPTAGATGSAAAGAATTVGAGSGAAGAASAPPAASGGAPAAARGTTAATAAPSSSTASRSPSANGASSSSGGAARGSAAQGGAASPASGAAADTAPAAGATRAAPAGQGAARPEPTRASPISIPRPGAAHPHKKVP